MVIKIYGMSQNPDTKDYIMVLQYADGGNLNNWLTKNYKYFSWTNKLDVLRYIIDGLIKIHQRRIVHRDFHTGNILLEYKYIGVNANYAYISDMGLSGKVNNVDEKNIYGVMPYLAPEVLRRKPYTEAADIYSFSMVMYFIATGRQPFADRAHDEFLVLDICKGIRPEINEPEAPRCYIELMEKCWSSNPINRPNVTKISGLINSFVNAGEISKSFEEAEKYRKSHFSFFESRQSITHPQAIYTSRLLNPFTEGLSKYDDNTECFDCVIKPDIHQE